MKFRPCIDIHNGQVKQIVGGSLDDDKGASENFVSILDGSYYGELYKKYGLKGGHIILLNKYGTPEYDADIRQARLALRAFPGGLQIGGGITDANAADCIKIGASHVIVTSFIFDEKGLSTDRLSKLVESVGREHIVIDLSCRRKGDDYYVVTNRWQTFTETKVNADLLEELSVYCDEYLIHGVDVEGKKQGVDERLLTLIAQYEGLPVTYAGGIKDMSDIDTIDRVGRGRIDYTVGSALSIFGGNIDFDEVVNRNRCK